MGPEVAALLLAGGTAAQMVGSRQQAKEQRNILNRAYEANDKTQGQSTQMVLDEGQKSAPTSLSQAIQQAQTQTADRTMGDLKGAGGAMVDSTSGQGAVSGAYETARAERAAQEGERLNTIVGQQSAARAPGQALTDSAMRRSALAERIGSMGSDARNRTQAAQLDAQGVDAPWYSDVGKIASLVGGASLMGGAGAGAAAGETYALGPAMLGEAGAAASSPWGAVKLGEAAALGPKLGLAAPAAAGGFNGSAMAQVLGTMAQRMPRGQNSPWLGR